MNTPYLIQRARFEESDRKGIDGILTFDYMGSAEFEFGALPKSLKRIRSNIGDYTVDKVSVNGNQVNILCKSRDLKDVLSFLEMLSKKKYPMMKEQPRFYQYVNGEESGHSFMNMDHWWDIENDFMFWRDKKGFDGKLLDEMGI